jgi:hypothetical protein
MGLFDQVLGAINNPDQQASPDQLGNILQVVQQLSHTQGADTSQSQALVSIVGQHVRAALQQQRSAVGNSQVEALVNQFGGSSANLEAVQALFSPDQQERLVEEASQRTGLDGNKIQAMLPVIVPIALNFLKSGSTSTGEAGEGRSNSVLNTFLDGDADGDVDLGDALSMANRFLNR